VGFRFLTTNRRVNQSIYCSFWQRHWLYFQDFIDLFNEQNPGGNVLNTSTYTTILVLMVTIGVITSIKRVAVGLYLGRQTFGMSYFVAVSPLFSVL